MLRMFSLYATSVLAAINGLPNLMPVVAYRYP